MSSLPFAPAQERLRDETSRAAKAAKIMAVLERACGPRLAQARCLDVGCARGLITRHLAERFAATVGVEFDAAAVRQAAPFASPRLAFAVGDALRLPMPDEAVEVVICAQVYEHVRDAALLFEEIWRVLTPGGVCFFSGPNRLYPWEMHYRLPFIPWLPPRWADWIVRATRRGESFDVRLLTAGALRRLVARFQVEDYTLEVLRQPEAYHCAEELGRLRWISRLPVGVLRALLPLTPNWNWVLRKPIRAREEIQHRDTEAQERKKGEAA
jgi:SAM-dependent methyltransferase